MNANKYSRAVSFATASYGFTRFLIHASPILRPFVVKRPLLSVFLGDNSLPKIKGSNFHQLASSLRAHTVERYHSIDLLPGC